jgi:hypothetical protein
MIGIVSPVVSAWSCSRDFTPTRKIASTPAAS